MNAESHMDTFVRASPLRMSELTWGKLTLASLDYACKDPNQLAFRFNSQFFAIQLMKHDQQIVVKQ